MLKITDQYKNKSRTGVWKNISNPLEIKMGNKMFKHPKSLCKR